jgi:copper chaperone CopZ
MAEKNQVEKTATENAVLFVNPEQAIVVAKKNLVEASIKSYEDLEAFEKTYKDVSCKNVKDLAGYKFIVEGSKKAKKLRVDLEKKRKEVTAPALKFQKEVKSEADGIALRITSVEVHLNEQKTAFEDAERAEQQKVFQKRSGQLLGNGYDIIKGNYVCGAVHLSPAQILSFEDDELTFHIEIGQKELARKEAEAKRIKEQQDELAKEKKEFAMMKAELFAEKKKLAEQSAELAAQKKALDDAYGKTDEDGGKTDVTETKTDVDTKTDTSKVTETKTETEEVKQQVPTPDEIPALFVDGFELFRGDLIKLLDNRENKLTRAALKSWAKTNDIAR